MRLQDIFTKDALLQQAHKLRARQFRPGFDKMTADAAIMWIELNGERLITDILSNRWQPLPATGF